MSTVVVKKYVLDGIVELLKEYDAHENEVYDNLIKETPVEEWTTLKDLAKFKAQAKLKQIEFCLEPDHQAQLKKLYISEQDDLQKYLWNHGENNYFVNDGAGNIMYEGLDEETAREYAARFPEYSIGR
tara:strand:- start:152 stop:535 length:384 start_codon:yes stop_codon:yes gene_type:complete